ncbi:MAG: DUF2207 domain-containing protein [Calditrichaeota bacterium]|nr:MAG: DUF2207 domain-containing protein [Calditrichota bacterium]
MGGSMKKIGRLIVLLFVCFITITAAPLSARDFTIKNFDVHLQIDENGKLYVIETIEVFFHTSRHGIFREIPYKYKDEFGDTKKMPIDILSVTDNNDKKLTTKISKTGNVVNIRIGDADIYVRGTQYYKIRYEVKNALLFFDDHDELYWNVTGTYWDATIEKATATVSFITEEKVEQLQYDCYTGRYGSSESNCDINEYVLADLGSGVRFSTFDALKPYEGLTIAIGWEKGIIAEPSDFEKFMMRTNLKENIFFLLPVLSLLFMFIHWRRHGRDPKTRAAVMVQYEPPSYNGKQLTPAELGTLIDESFDQRDMSASIIGLAVKGYINIEDKTEEVFFIKKSDYQLTKLKDADSELTSYETLLLVALFEDGSNTILISDLKGKFFEHIYTLRKTVYKQLVEKSYFKSSPLTVIYKYVGYGFVTLIFTLLALFFLVDFDYQIKAVFIAILTSIPMFLFSKSMPAKTRAGATALSDTLGFQEFLQRAEKDKLERMNDKQLFSKYLPYAIALDVVSLWAKAFDGIEQDQPKWYVSSYHMPIFHPVMFSKAIETTASTLGSTTFSAPRSSGLSGGGGGGFSGGGGGGGGGGSW